jgi:tetratricopeptide (TPR) repeat protein
MRKAWIKILFLMAFVSCLIRPIYAQDVQESLGKAQPGYMLLHYQEGNITGSGQKEYVAFYNDEKQYEMFKKDSFYVKHPERLERDVNKVVVYLIKQNKITLSFDLGIQNVGHKESGIYGMNVGNNGLTGWDGYCYLLDLNKDGLDEIVLFPVDGIGMGVELYNYDSERKIMGKVLEGPPNGGSLDSVEVRQEGDKNIIRLYNPHWIRGPGTRDAKYYLEWYDYAWDSKSGKYEVIKEGSVKTLDEKIPVSASNITKNTFSERSEELHKEGFGLYKAHKDAEAVKKYEEALKLDESAGLYFDYANSLSNLPKRQVDSSFAYVKAIELGYEKKEIAYYNLACVYSKMSKIPEAYSNLNIAVQNGYKSVSHMLKDPDLKNVRSDKDWEEFYRKLNPKSKHQ